MICPNCRSEIGSQPYCPYCGTQFSARYRERDRMSQTTYPVREQSGSGISNSTLRQISKRLAAMEMQNRLLLVLLCGSFFLQLLLFVLILVK